MKKIIVALLLIALIFSATSFTIANNYIDVWFAPEKGSQVGQTIANLINYANKSIYAAVYDINDSSLVGELVYAKRKGIDVKVVMDDEESADEWDKIINKII